MLNSFTWNGLVTGCVVTRKFVSNRKSRVFPTVVARLQLNSAHIMLQPSSSCKSYSLPCSPEILTKNLGVTYLNIQAKPPILVWWGISPCLPGN